MAQQRATRQLESKRIKQTKQKKQATEKNLITFYENDAHLYKYTQALKSSQLERSTSGNKSKYNFFK